MNFLDKTGLTYLWGLIKGRFVSKDGDTMTGTLHMTKSDDFPSVAFDDSRGQHLIIRASNSTTRARLMFEQKMNDESSYEGFYLPSTTEILSSSQQYPILTGKEAVTISQGGTGATSASAARSNLGLGSVLSDVSDMQDALGNAAFVYKQIPASGSAAFTFSTNCSYVVLITGPAAGVRCMLFGYCNTSGTVSQTKMDAASTTNITVTTSTNKLTIANSYSSAAYAILLKISGTAPT